jgi:hypothetical protein
MKNSIVGQTSKKLSVEAIKIFDTITFKWSKATEYVLDIATILNDLQSDKGKQQLWYEIRSHLIDEKIMSKTVISNLCSIGRNQVLYKHIDLLPPSYNALAELSRIPEDELSKKFKQGLINSSTLLSSVKQLRNVDYIDVDGVQVIEKHIDKKDKIKAVTIYLSESDIIKKHELINENLQKLKSMMRYADIEISGLLKRKIEDD